MNDITREAGVSKGTIYVYFANKVELFEALVDEERCGMFSNMYDVLNQGGNLRETLIRFGVALVSKVTSKKAIMAQRVVIGASERIPELGARFYEQGPLHGHAKLQAFLRLSGEAGIARHRRHWSGGLPALGAFSSGLMRQHLFGYRTEQPAPEEVQRTVTAAVDLFLKAYAAAK